MHYFKRNIGDYHRKAGRLTMLEHGAYTLLMDACYDREDFPTKDQALDWCFARTDEEIKAVEYVLGKFFTQSEDGTYVQSRIMQELLNYQKTAEVNKQIAIDREENRRLKRKGDENESSTNRAPTVNEPPPNHKPLTTNHEPDTTPTSKPSVSPCPVEQIISEYKSTVKRLPSVRIVPDVVKANIRARWRQDEKFQSIEFWHKLFAYCDNHDFLSGQIDRQDKKPWRASLAWIVKASNFAKIINEEYER